MTVQFDYPDAFVPTVTWKPMRNPDWPVRRRIDYPAQVQGSTASGTLLVQQVGSRAEVWELEFQRLSESDRTQALEFFDAVRKSFSPFDFTDGQGGVHRVRWINPFEFNTSAEGRYTAAIHLRKE